MVWLLYKQTWQHA